MVAAAFPIPCLSPVIRLGLFFLGASGVSQESTTVRVDAFIATEMGKQHIPGMSLAVVTNGQIAYAKAYGFANIEHHVSAKCETVFQSASLGKQFTSHAI